ncbi:MAG: polysaccharide deacetylase family protein [Paludibacteraceae bacterium]|nr:polysaccharide deacetylase family protein [Paludibacteraceae bacterium]
MIISELINKLCSKWMKFCLQPIRVFCLHHVCEQFDAESMYPCDWMALSEFKQTINALRRKGYQFISLTEAYNYLKKDYFRRKKYAVLTFDDGYKSLLEVLPWLEKQSIPATLFINGKYLDGTSYRETPKEQYLTYDELFALNSPLIEVGHHGWEHVDATKMTEENLEESLHNNIEILSYHLRYIPFLAYTWGRHNVVSDCCLKQKNIIPLIITSGKNYKFKDYIDRELL